MHERILRQYVSQFDPGIDPRYAQRLADAYAGRICHTCGRRGESFDQSVVGWERLEPNFCGTCARAQNDRLNQQEQQP